MLFAPLRLQLWFLAAGRLQQVSLLMERTLYVDSTLPPNDPRAAVLGVPVTRVLPSGRRAANLYAVGSQAHARMHPCWLVAMAELIAVDTDDAGAGA